MMVRGRKYPEKTTINLAQKEHRHHDLGMVLPTAIVLVIVIAVFCKFGVVDRLNAVNDVSKQAEQQEEILANLRSKTADYDAVLEEYQSCIASQSAAGSTVDALKCLSLLEENLLQKSQVVSFNIASDVISVQLSGVTLNEISAIYQDLMSSTLVAGVQVYTAATNEKENNSFVTANMTIQLVAVGAVDSGEEAAS